MLYRFLFSILAVAGCLALPTGVALAQEQPGCNAKTTLGLERVIEIDTAKGPRIGHVQYKDIDFLRPGEVVLTFDDGPSRQTTPAVLEALSAHCTKATFFMVGRMAIADPEMVRKVAALGHTVASHTWSHKNLGAISASSAEREVELGMSAITAALGKPIAPFFRFPYLSDPRRVISHLEERNQAILSIDVDSYDWRARSRTVMFNNVLSQLNSRGKGIILFHDIQRITASNIKALLDELKRRGYKVVHMVPKTTAVTLASYDKMAGEMLAKREVAAAAKPLAPRAMVWPMAAAGREPTEKVARPESQETLPWSKESAGSGTKRRSPAAARAVAATSSERQSASAVRPSPQAQPRPRPRREPTLMELMFGSQLQ